MNKRQRKKKLRKQFLVSFCNIPVFPTVWINESLLIGSRYAVQLNRNAGRSTARVRPSPFTTA